jgi:hypothetical protein
MLTLQIGKCCNEEVTFCGGDRAKLVNALCGTNAEFLLLDLARACNKHYGLRS